MNRAQIMQALNNGGKFRGEPISPLIAQYYAWEMAPRADRRWDVAPMQVVNESPIDEQFATARHEAAHAAVVLHFGGTVSELVANGGAGHCRHRNVDDTHLPLVSMAAWVEAGEADGSRKEFYSSDRRQLVDEFRAIGLRGTDEDVRAFAMQFEDEVQHILAVTCFFRRECAARLAERGRLSGTEVLEIWNRTK